MTTDIKKLEKAYETVGLAIKGLVEVLADTDENLETLLKELVEDKACCTGDNIGIFAENHFQSAILKKAIANGYKLELDDWQDLISYSKGD